MLLSQTMLEASRKLNVLDAIRQYPDNKDKNLSVVDLAEEAFRASGLVIPSLEVLHEVAKTPTLVVAGGTSTNEEGGIAEIVVAHQAPPTQFSEHTLILAAASYRDHKDSRVYLSELLSAFWENHRVPMGLAPSDVRVTDCPYTDEDIWQFMKLDDPKPGNPDVDLGFYLPQVLATKQGLILLGKGFPEMGTWVFQEDDNITNGHQEFGWLRVDASLDAPYRTNKNGELTGLNVDELNEAIRNDKRRGQIVNIYGPSGKLIKQVFDYYPDQGNTWSRLPESLEGGGRVLGAGFGSGGFLRVYSYWNRKERHPGMGGRSFLGA